MLARRRRAARASTGTMLPVEIAVQRRRTSSEHDADDEEVGRHREDAPRLADAAQVAERQEREERQAELDRYGSSSGNADVIASDAGRDADRHRQRVVDQQRRGGDQAGGRADVLLGDDVGAAAVGIGVDRLAVGERDDRQQRRDDAG